MYTIKRIWNWLAPTVGAFLLFAVTWVYLRDGTVTFGGTILALFGLILLSWPWLGRLRSKISWKEITIDVEKVKTSVGDIKEPDNPPGKRDDNT